MANVNNPGSKRQEAVLPGTSFVTLAGSLTSKTSSCPVVV